MALNYADFNLLSNSTSLKGNWDSLVATDDQDWYNKSRYLFGLVVDLITFVEDVHNATPDVLRDKFQIFSRTSAYNLI